MVWDKEHRGLNFEVIMVIRTLLSRYTVPLLSIPRRFLGDHGRSSFRVILRDHVEVSSNKKTLNGFRTFCTKEDLSAKKCVPCNSKDLRPMTEEAARKLIPQVPEWELVNEDGKLKIRRSLKVKSFLKGLELFEEVAGVAETQGHHPDLHLVGWNNVRIEIWTHAVGGLTENDFILATKINKLNLQHLLRIKLSN